MSDNLAAIEPGALHIGIAPILTAALSISMPKSSRFTTQSIQTANIDKLEAIELDLSNQEILMKRVQQLVANLTHV